MRESNGRSSKESACVSPYFDRQRVGYELRLLSGPAVEASIVAARLLVAFRVRVKAAFRHTT